MNRDKQIEEMAKCCPYYSKGECCADVTDICDCNLMCHFFGAFANLEMAGYRKASEVAREIFEEIENSCRTFGVYGIHGYIMEDIAELKKKYTGSEKDDG